MIIPNNEVEAIVAYAPKPHLERYHPLFVFNQFGDIERALLSNGNVYEKNRDSNLF